MTYEALTQMTAELVTTDSTSPSFRTSVLVMGPVCTGKTWSLRTLLPRYPDDTGDVRVGCCRQVIIISLEPGFYDTLGNCTCNMGMHVACIPPLDAEWSDLVDLAKRVSSAQDVTKVVDPNKRSYDQFLQIYSTLQHFTCERCGTDFGPVDKLDESYVVALDGLTGLSSMAMHFTVGLKPSKSWPEFDAAGQQVENLLRKCVSMRPSFVLIAHIDREPDPLGGTKLTMHTIGNKLAPRLTKDLFSEIVYTRRDDRNRFWWSTIETNMDLKARRLPFSDQITPSFDQIFKGE